MEVSLVGNEISVFEKCYEQLIRKEEMLDCVVPDVMPDIEEILDVVSNVYIRSKDTSAGRVKIEAECVLSVLYIPEGGAGVQVLPVTLPFYISVEDGRISDAARCIADISIAACEAKMLNSRKVFSRAELAFMLSCYEEKTVSVTSDAVSSEPLCKRCEEIVITPVTSIEEKSFVITEEYPIPASKGEVTQILSKCVTLVPLEAKPVGTKIVFRGNIAVSLCCLNSRGETEGIDFVSSFSQVIETGGECSIFHCSLRLTPSAFYADISSSGDERGISAEVHIVAQLCCMEERRLSCLADVYSNSCLALPEFSAQEHICAKSAFSQREVIRETIECDSGARVISCRAVIARPSISLGEVSLDGELKIVYALPDGRLRRAARRISLKTSAELSEKEELCIDCVYAGEWSVTPSGEGIEIRIPVMIEGAILEKRMVCSINAINLSERDSSAFSSPSAVIMKVSSEDSLWEIAKENRSTVELIRSVNALDEMDDGWKKFVLIPCCSR